MANPKSKSGEKIAWGAKPRAKKAKSSYDLPTPEKVAFGERMRLAREAADITQAEAAKRLGYAAATQLSNMESGNRPVPLELLIKAAVLYGTSMDYLCGLSDDPDRDPAAASVRYVSGRVTTEVNRLVALMVHTSVDALRKVLPTATEGQRLAGLILELHGAVGTFRSLNKRFDSMPGGNALITRSDIAAAAAIDYSSRMRRAQRMMNVNVYTPNGEKAQASLLPVMEEGGA